MIARPFAALALLILATATGAAWELERIETAGPVRELVEIGGEPHIATASGWFRAVIRGNTVRLESVSAPRLPPLPRDALPDARITAGKREIARTWFAQPTTRYRHGVLGDAIEAESLVVERRDGKREIVGAGDDAVFEDIEPRIADLGDGERVLVVKSYLAAGSALAVVGERAGRFAVLAETPAIGTPHRWLNPAGIADFDGDGAIEIALVKMPHALGRLELWRWQSGNLTLTAAVTDASNHAIGSRALRQSSVADFDGDGVADLAIPSFDRRAIRLLSFRDGAHEVARVALPAAPVTDFVLLPGAARPEILIGVSDGRLLRLRR